MEKKDLDGQTMSSMPLVEKQRETHSVKPAWVMPTVIFIEMSGVEGGGGAGADLGLS